MLGRVLFVALLVLAVATAVPLVKLIAATLLAFEVVRSRADSDARVAALSRV